MRRSPQRHGRPSAHSLIFYRYNSRSMFHRLTGWRQLLLPLLACGGYATDVPLTMLTDSRARCLDGSMAGYYYQPAPVAEDSKKWVIYLEGGGECDNEEACTAQLTSSLGSSKYFPETSNPSSWYFASDYCPYNPDLCGWNHVRDPYCTQDLHAGQIEEPTEDTWGMYFAGHHVFTAMLDTLDETAGLQDATDIVLSGTSAGGIGVWMNVDYVAQRYPNARVTAATVAGFYFYATYYSGPNHTEAGSMADFREEAWPKTYELYNAFVDQDCKEYYELRGLSAGACMMSNNSLPFIESDAFVVQAQTDQVVLTGHDEWPEEYMYNAPEALYMDLWHHNMTVGLGPLMSSSSSSDGPRYGVFAAACYTHGGFTHSYPLINGYNFYDAFRNFYFVEPGSESDDPFTYKLSDDCGVMCNPTCNGGSRK